MALIFEKVTDYQVFLYGAPGNARREAVIAFTIPQGFAFMDFYPENLSLPGNRMVPHISGGNLYFVSYRYGQFQNALGLLRNEGSASFFFNEESLDAYLCTGGGR